MLVVVSYKKVDSDKLIRYSINEFCILENIPSFDYDIVRENNTKPMMYPPKLHFNVSHSRDIVACAVSKSSVGIDIEYKKNIDYKTISKRFFEREIKDKESFYIEWTKKEAYAKLTGSNLIQQLNTSTECLSLNVFSNYALSIASSDRDIVFYNIPKEKYEQN